MRRNPKTGSKHLRVFLVGHGISKSISPAMHNAAFKKMGLKAHYSLFDVSDNEFDSEITKILRATDILGFNVTVPYKERILQYVSKLDKQARSVGAINTVKVSNGKILGFNTDVDGLRVALSNLGVSRNAKKCVILGAGGAARACAYTVLKSGFDSLTILNRSADRANKMVIHFKELFSKASIEGLPIKENQFVTAVADCDLLINAITSSRTLLMNVDFENAPRNMRFFDLGYRAISPILRGAISSGIKSSDGLSMLVEQAAKSFEIWTGVTAPREVMAVAARKELSRRNSN